MRGEKKNNKLKCNVCVGLEEKGDQAMLPICEDIVISEANVSYSCDECDQLFKSKGQLTKHRKAEHNVKLRFECKQCGNCYSSDQVYYFKQLRFYFENPFVIFYGFKKWSLTSGNWDTVLFSSVNHARHCPVYSVPEHQYIRNKACRNPKILDCRIPARFYYFYIILVILKKLSANIHDLSANMTKIVSKCRI